MPSLKQEMRQMFEKRSSMAFYDNNAKFEEGLLEKIINLAFANLYHFSNKHWKITAVKSPVLLQKLYPLTGNKKIIESAYALIICESDRKTDIHTASSDRERFDLHRTDLDLLALSIGYAAKFYCIDYLFIRSFDRAAVSREFSIDRQSPVAAIICLGFFRDPSSCVSCAAQGKSLYSDTVRVL